MNTEHALILAVHLARRRPKREAHRVADDVQQLDRLAHQADCVNLRQSINMPTEQAAPKRERIRAKVRAVLEPYGLKAQVETDPRGYAIRIAGLPSNSWSGAGGFGIGS